MNLVLYIKDAQNCPKMHLEGEKSSSDIVPYFKNKKSLYSLGKTMKQNLKHFLFVATFLPMLMNKAYEIPLYFLVSAIFLARLSYYIKGCMLL